MFLLLAKAILLVPIWSGGRAGGVISESDTDRIYPASTVCWPALAFKLNQLVGGTKCEKEEIRISGVWDERIR